MFQQMKAITYIGVTLILYILYKYISDGTGRRDPRRTERPPSLYASSSSSSNPQDTPLDASSPSSTNSQDTPPLGASSSSSSNPRDNYDVFLSFTARGGTWRTFTSHLYSALEQKGIYTFLDVKKLERGQDISPGLDNAIKSSRCAVVVLSEEYTSSHWCMDELVQILKCRNDSNINQIVLPIFYHVNPDDIRKEEGIIWEGFQGLIREFPIGIANNEEKVESWRDALKQLSNALKQLPGIAGDHVDNTCVNESKFIEDFIEVVSSKLFDAALLNISKDLVGMDSRLEKLKLCVSTSQFGGVRFIGIFGLGGLGKTTLARAYFKYASCQFQGSSFLANVRQACEKEHDDGLVKLQKQLLTDILKGEHSLEGLAEENNWFGDGSQIIVTTRDESLLRSMYGKKEYIIHKVDELEEREALQLFSLKAFKRNCPPEDYRELSTKVVKYASGLPLALVVLGSFLRGKKTIDEWEDALDRLKKYSDEEIMRVLRISFDGLVESEKNIFLDIACFFNGHTIDYVMTIMDSCGFYPKAGIRSLLNKSLLHIDHDGNTLRMHDLLEEMGKQIVQGESRKEPGRRSRIWRKKDFYHVMSNGTIDRCTDNECLPNELRCLWWDGFSFKSFPRSFQPHGLVELSIHSRVMERLWDDPMMEPLYNLKSINLGSPRIRKLENFHLFPNLEKLILYGCLYLKEIDPSIEVLERLTLLNLEHCQRLKSLPTCMGGLISLKDLNLSDCLSLGDLPEALVCSNAELDVTGTGLRDITPSVGDLKALKLQSHGWKNIWNTIVGNGLYSAGLFCLQKLDLRYCGLRDGAFPDDFGCLVSLEYLDLRRNKFSYLPAHFNQLSKLRHLDLSHCENLTSLGPELPDSLERIKVNYCGELHTFLDPSSQFNLQCSEIYCVDYFKLVNRQGSKRTAITSLGRYLQNPPKPSKRFDIVLPGNEIPSWFTHKVMRSSSISLPLYPNWCTNKWMGFALSLCLCTMEGLLLKDWYWEIKINEEDWGFGHVHWAGEKYWNGKDMYIWLLYFPRDTYFQSEWQKKFGQIQFSLKHPQEVEIVEFKQRGAFGQIEFKYPQEEEVVEFKQCGVHLVYEQDVEVLNLTARHEPI
ncbi:hypothetical protein FNV43_RR00812 [Rhamnella rubrinervis]|uniref:TIR domain-containing protein n=1 Tax=Rhamnella rubrinervis TaxID=2594499 RepID=A0A8K0HNP4_9ROSA|nr:hypothetical protein FNV43_RR00812 [Rhamnella rubrinervis]